MAGHRNNDIAGQGRRPFYILTGREKRALFLLAALLLWTVLLESVSSAKPAALPEESQACLGCHARQGLVKKFDSGEHVSAHVDPEKYGASVHNFLPCSGCHREFAAGEHPERRFRDGRQYRVKSARVCRGCHRDDALKANSIHAGLLKKEEQGQAPICSDCHAAHEVLPVSGGKVFATEEKYCMSCHAYEMMASFKNGEKMPLTVDSHGLRESAHKNLSCSDCHFGFSSEDHPKRNFRSRREYTLSSLVMCRRCHFDKYTKTIESIHYVTLSQGRLDSPTCVDCHGSHVIRHISNDRTTSAEKCRKCHGREYDVYAKSVHGAALFSEHNRDVPVCIDCHTAHEIRNPLEAKYHDNIPEMCSNCHANERIMGKYGLSTDVVKSYLSDFHGVTLGFYIRQKEEFFRPERPIAVCTDCHGTHNITSTTGPDATVVKANLLKKCQKCHTDASGDFPDTWMSHYIPTLANAPLVFLVNAAFKVMLPAMVVGLILQMLLHMWRYLVNR